MNGMEAGMCSCDFDFEPCDVLEYKIVKARKEHKCDECCTLIKPGTNYQRIKALWEGSWENMKRCVPCSKIAKEYCCSIIGRGAVHAWCWEYLGVDLKTGETTERTFYA